MESSVFSCYETNLTKSYLGKTGTHCQIVNGFLDHFASTYASECLTGCDGSGDAIVMIVPSNLTKLGVYEEYVNEFRSLRKKMTPLVTMEIPSDPLTFSWFTKYWNMDRAHLRVAKPESEFYYFCSSLKYDLYCIDKNDAKYEVLNNILDAHHKNAGLEHDYYRKYLEYGAKDERAPQHFVFDFAGNVLLPRLI